MVELKNITKIYELSKSDKVTALDDVNLFIKEGEVVVLSGASGSGKSSILSLIAGLSKPTSGEVIVGDKKISKLSDNFASQFRRDNIGFIFQKYNLLPNLTVRDNILLPLVPLNPDADVAEEKLAHVMQLFSISHKADVLVKNLSGGEQQRVAIARANINNPKIIIADEPTANLDEKLSLSFIDILKELKSLGKTIIIATHDPLFLNLDFVDKKIDIHNGKIV